MEERTRFLDIKSQIQIRLMNDADYANMSAFSCGVKTLDDFFQLEVKECVRRHYLSAYTVFLDTGAIVAAFTLMNDALMIGSQTEKDDFIEDLKLETDEDVVAFLNRQSSYPAINIGHLGTLKDYQGLGIGSMIIDLVADTYAKHRQSGCQFITVDALNNDRTTSFYYKNSFGFQTNRDSASPTRRMYRIL
ncbi:MAG: GNAT family N-acetyltransferase [Muribaculaceae bacterium]|nr:GNAT family N-acetyltransferase [Muribaculaceae bacterium]MDE6391655.1 GNAT family N-acetyltransferase [Muribaculaceae bacterium]